MAISGVVPNGHRVNLYDITRIKSFMRYLKNNYVSYEEINLDEINQCKFKNKRQRY